jgi:hypothetical protein
MVRRSNRRNPVTVVETSDEEFISVSSEDRYVFFFVCFLARFFYFSFLLSSVASRRTMFKNPTMMNLITANIIFVARRVESNSPRRVQSTLLRRLSLLIQMTMTCKSSRVYFVCIRAFLSLAFYRQPSTPPPTPSPVKPVAGKKRAIGTYESDGDDVFVPRYFYFYSPQCRTC